MLRQVVIFMSAVAVAVSLGNGAAFHSKKNTFQKQGQYASVASFHSTKNAAPQPAFQPQAPQTAFQPQAAAPQIKSAPSPYSFGYESDGSARQESADASGKVTGSYTVLNEDGSVRVVKYVADENGFRADIDTNEAGTKSSNPANAAIKSAFVEPSAPIAQAPKKHVASKTSFSASQPQYEQKPIQYNLGDASQPSPYSFNYEAQLEDGGSSSRSESSDGSGKVTGHYSLSVADGRRRQVDYSSGSDGFQAKIDTNEFGTKSDSPAHVQFYSSAPQEAPAAPAPSSYSKTNYQEQKQIGAFSTSPIKQQPIKTNAFSTSPVKQQPIQINTFSTSPVKQQPIQDYSHFDNKPSPYSFSYDAQLEDGSSSRTESADSSGKVVGSYSLSTADGRKRTIDYEADHNGFRANVNTNEFGTKSDSPADVQFYSNAPKEAPASYADQYSQKKIPATFKVEQSPLSSGSQFKSTYQGQSAVQYNQASSIENYAPYNFNYVAQLDDGSSSRTESGDGSGKVQGSYSLSANDGRQRTVDYSADQAGFRATVNTNEFGTKSDSPADVQFYSNAPLVAPQEYKAPKASPSAYKSTYQSGGATAQFHSASSKGAFATQQRVEAEPSYQPSPYSFGYEAEATGGSSARSESSDASGKVTGSYTVRNEDGSQRVVEYIADKDGFRANVKTNEPGTKSDDPADVMFKSDAPAYTAPAQQAPSKANFPARTYTQKSSMISQKSVDAWSR